MQWQVLWTEDKGTKNTGGRVSMITSSREAWCRNRAPPGCAATQCGGRSHLRLSPPPSSRMSRDASFLLYRHCVAALQLQLEQALRDIPGGDAVGLVVGGKPPLPPFRPVQRPQEHVRVDILLHQVVEELADILEGRGQLHCPTGPPPAGAVRVAHALQHGTDVLNRAAHDHLPHHLPVAAGVHRPTNPR